MHRTTALFLTAILFNGAATFAQETVLDWSNKVIELQEVQGQNFEQDLTLVKGLLYLQRRSEALDLILKMGKIHHRKDPRLTELFEAASNQYFAQETGELFAEASILIRDENWLEAKDRLETALKKEPLHRELILHSIQVLLVTGGIDRAAEIEKAANPYYGDSTIWKIYRAWILIHQKNGKEAIRILSALWNADRKPFERQEAWMLAFLKAMELNKYQLDLEYVDKIIQKHPEWICSRLTRLKLRPLSSAKHKKELFSIRSLMKDMTKYQKAIDQQAKDSRNQYKGLIPTDACKKEVEELILKISETK
jgi:hypothetical protein